MDWREHPGVGGRGAPSDRSLRLTYEQASLAFAAGDVKAAASHLRRAKAILRERSEQQMGAMAALEQAANSSPHPGRRGEGGGRGGREGREGRGGEGAERGGCGRVLGFDMHGMNKGECLRVLGRLVQSASIKGRTLRLITGINRGGRPTLRPAIESFCRERGVLCEMPSDNEGCLDLFL